MWLLPLLTFHCVCMFQLFVCAIFRGFTAFPGTDIINPGLVADGTRCGNGLVRHVLYECMYGVLSLPLRFVMLSSVLQ